jgi:hypothetical protein
MEELPLGQAGLMKHEFIELGPLTPLHLLLSEGAGQMLVNRVSLRSRRAHSTRFPAVALRINAQVFLYLELNDQRGGIERTKPDQQ